MGLLPIPELPKLPEVPGLPDFPDVPEILEPDCNPQKSICAKMAKQLDDAISTIENAKDAFRNKIINTVDDLTDFGLNPPSDPGALDDALVALNEDAANTLPSLDDCDPDEIRRILEACGIAFPSFDSPRKMLKDMTDWIGDQFKDLFGDWNDAEFNFPFPDLPSFQFPQFQLPEFQFGLEFDAFDDFLEDLKFPDLLGSLDGLFNCLDSICKDQDLDAKITRVNNALSEIAVNDEGKLDLDTILDSSGISEAHKVGVRNVKDNINGLKNKYKTATEKTANTANQTVKIIKKEATTAEGAIPTGSPKRVKESAGGGIGTANNPVTEPGVDDPAAWGDYNSDDDKYDASKSSDRPSNAGTTGSAAGSGGTRSTRTTSGGTSDTGTTGTGAGGYTPPTPVSPPNVPPKETPSAGQPWEGDSSGRTDYLV